MGERREGGSDRCIMICIPKGVHLIECLQLCFEVICLSARHYRLCSVITTTHKPPPASIDMGRAAARNKRRHVCMFAKVLLCGI